MTCGDSLDKPKGRDLQPTYSEAAVVGGVNSGTNSFSTAGDSCRAMLM